MELWPCDQIETGILHVVFHVPPLQNNLRTQEKECVDQSFWLEVCNNGKIDWRRTARIMKRSRNQRGKRGKDAADREKTYRTIICISAAPPPLLPVVGSLLTLFQIKMLDSKSKEAMEKKKNIGAM